MKKLDDLWVKNSNGKYGYSVIKKIWLETGNSLKVNWNTGRLEDFNEKAYNNFYDRIGWKEKGEWLTYEKGMGEEFMGREGHLPLWAVEFWNLSQRKGESRSRYWMDTSHFLPVNGELEKGYFFLLAETCRL